MYETLDGVMCVKKLPSGRDRVCGGGQDAHPSKNATSLLSSIFVCSIHRKSIEDTSSRKWSQQWDQGAHFNATPPEWFLMMHGLYDTTPTLLSTVLEDVETTL